MDPDGTKSPSALPAPPRAGENPYAAPGAQAVGTATEDDIAAAVPPMAARVAGGVMVLAGFVVGLTGAQTLAIVTVRGPMSPAPYVLAMLGVAELVLGVVVFRARAWGTVLAIASGAILTIASSVWLLFSVRHGLFSLFALAAPFASVAAGVFAALAMGPCQRATEARDRLRAQGMNLGI
jgi:hypothetical protein